MEHTNDTPKSSPLVVVAAAIGAAVTLLFFLVPTPLMNAAKIAASTLFKQP